MSYEGLTLRLESISFEEVPLGTRSPVALNIASDLFFLSEKLGIRVVVDVNGRDMVAKGSTKWIYENWLRPTTYVCERCGNDAPKDLWGPGRIKCPNCGAVARTADGDPR